MAAIRFEQSTPAGRSRAGNSYPAHLRMILALIFIAAFAYFIVTTLRWPLLWDGQVMHYINFLMAHGMAPYRDIIDMNMPGAYLVDGWQIHLFGPGDLAWRFYDFFLLAALLLAMIVIAWPYDWLAGVVAGVLFTFVHASEGPANAGQRDEAMTALILAGYALLFHALRKKQPSLLLPFGACMGLAISIKPTVGPLVLVLGIMVFYTLKKRGEALFAYVGYATAGVLVPALIVVYFLAHNHATGAFLEISRRLTPYYATLDHPTLLELARRSLPVPIFVLLPFGIAAALLDRSWVNWERWALLLGVGFGGFSFFIQGKGYQYHRYTFLAFLLLWLILELTLALQRQRWSWRIGFAGLLYCTFAVLPFFIYRLHVVDPSNKYVLSLEADLTRLGGDKLQHQVQCLDMVDGCLDALYHLKLVQNTGSTGDLLFFAPHSSPVVDYYRRMFWDQVHANPPEIFILSDEWFNGGRGYRKLEKWPQLAEYLNTDYSLMETRHFDAANYGNPSYRIYMRKR